MINFLRMKRIINIRAILVVLDLSLIFSGCQNSKEEQMRHIVIFKYNPTATAVQIEKVTNALSDLQNKIPGIVAFEHGVNDSPENKNNGFTHVYMFTFEDAEARDTYLPHPEHQKFGEMLGEMNVVKDVLVVDYAIED
jgi:hypothetical protein